MTGPRRYESTETLVVDLSALAQATRSDDDFEEWAAAEVQRAVRTSSSPPPPSE